MAGNDLQPTRYLNNKYQANPPSLLYPPTGRDRNPVPAAAHDFADEDEEDGDYVEEEDRAAEDDGDGDDEDMEEFVEDVHPEQVDLLRREAEMELTVTKPPAENPILRFQLQRQQQPHQRKGQQPQQQQQHRNTCAGQQREDNVDDREEPSTPVHAARRARRDDLVDRVRTSLFDILGSATRRPVHPQWRPVGTDADNNNDNNQVNDNNPSNASRRANNNHDRRSNRQRRGRPTTSLPSIHPEGRQTGYDNVRPTGQTIEREDDVVQSDGEEDDDSGRDEGIPNLGRYLRQLSKPTVFMAIAAVFAILVILMLDARVSQRRGLPPATDRLQVDPVLSTARQVFKLLFRNAYPYPQARAPIDGLELTDPRSDLVTRDELRNVFLPELLNAAREAASTAASEALGRAESARQNAEATALRKQQELQEEQDVQRRKEEDARIQAAIAATLAQSRGEQERFVQFAERYAADKDLPPDFALGSAGGAVVATQPSAVVLWARFARAYATALVSERTFTPTWPQPAAVVLHPDVLPGNCWAFDGDRGSLTIRLARPVRVSAVTVEHTPRTSVFSVASALRMFRVVGIPVGPEMQEWPLHRNMLVFDVSKDNSRHLQTFEFEHGGYGCEGDDCDDDGGLEDDDDDNNSYNGYSSPQVLRAVRFEILSNHGANFTAVYRIRVHGEEQVKAFDGVDGGEL